MFDSIPFTNLSGKFLNLWKCFFDEILITVFVTKPFKCSRCYIELRCEVVLMQCKIVFEDSILNFLFIILRMQPGRLTRSRYQDVSLNLVFLRIETQETNGSLHKQPKSNGTLKDSSSNTSLKWHLKRQHCQFNSTYWIF